MTKTTVLVLSALLLVLCVSAARADGGDPRSEYIAGLAEQRAGNYQAAIDHYKVVLDADPSYATADRLMGDCYYYLGDKAQAVRCYDLYLRARPGDLRIRRFADSIRGQANASYAGAITVNPIELIVGLADLQYEQRLNPGSSLAYRLSLWDESLGDTSFSAFGAGVAYRMYPGQEALHYFYWGPGVSIEDVNVKFSDPAVDESASGSGVVLGPSIEAGCQWVPFDTWAIDLGVSGTFYVGSVTASGDGYKSSAALSGFVPGLRLSMGYAWH